MEKFLVKKLDYRFPPSPEDFFSFLLLQFLPRKNVDKIRT